MNRMHRAFFVTAALLVLNGFVRGGPKRKITIGALITSTFATKELNMFERACEPKFYEQPALKCWPARLIDDATDAAERTVDISNVTDIIRKLCQRFKDEFTVFLVSSEVATVPVIPSYANRLHAPLITMATDIENCQFCVQMSPGYIEAIAELTMHMGWNKVYYIYNDKLGWHRLQIFQQIIGSLDIELIYKMVKGDVSDYKTLRTVDNIERFTEKFIILDLSSKSVLQEILFKISRLGMNRKEYNYILGGLWFVELDLSHFEYSDVNITGFSMKPPKKISKPLREVMKCIHNDECGSFCKTSDKKSQANLRLNFTEALILDGFALYMDVVNTVYSGGGLSQQSDNATHLGCSPLKPWHEGKRILGYLRKSVINGITGRISFDKNGLRKKYTLEIDMKNGKSVTHIGKWSPERHLQVKKEPTKLGPENTKNKTYIVTSVKVKPYLMEKTKYKSAAGPNARYEGYCADLTEKLFEKMNLKYILRPRDDTEYGEPTQPGQLFTGMVGEVQSNKADFAIAPLTILHKRERVVVFSKPFMRLGISIMIKRPEKQKPNVFSFMDPLENMIWACIIMASVGVSIVMYIVSRISPLQWDVTKTDGNKKEVSNDFSLSNSAWFALGALMQQGSDILPKSCSGRLIGSLWWFFTLIVIASYTANLAAFLTIEKMDLPIRSADDLLRHPDINYGTRRNGSTHDFFQDSEVHTYKLMGQEMKKKIDLPRTIDKGVQRVRGSKGKYAFLLESSTNDYHNQRLPCNTMKVPAPNLNELSFGIAMPHNSPLREKINIAILEMEASGLLSKLYSKWWYDKGECGSPGKQKDATRGLALSNVAGIFYILIGGLIISMFVALMEFIYKSRMDGHKSKTNIKAALKSEARFSIHGQSCNSEFEADSPPSLVSYSCGAGGYSSQKHYITFRDSVRSSPSQKNTLV